MDFTWSCTTCRKLLLSLAMADWAFLHVMLFSPQLSVCWLKNRSDFHYKPGVFLFLMFLLYVDQIQRREVTLSFSPSYILKHFSSPAHIDLNLNTHLKTNYYKASWHCILLCRGHIPNMPLCVYMHVCALSNISIHRVVFPHKDYCMHRNTDSHIK